MTDKERIKELAENNLSDVESKINGMFGFNESLYPELIAKRVVLKDLLFLIDSMQEEPIIVYVVTRCEEHDDYVEEVFLDEGKAIAYCKQFEGKEDEYSRNITTVKVTV